MKDLEEYPDNTSEAKEKAEQHGFEVLIATDYMLMLDLDHPADEVHWEKCCSRIDDFGLSISGSESWRSKSGNLHVLIHLNDAMPIRERIGTEAVLGSDRKRASLALRDVARGCEFPCMLFKPKVKS